MPQIALGVGAYSRPYGKGPEIRLLNRFFESNPLGAEQTALLARPPAVPFLTVGDGPIRGFYHQYGVFDGDLFIVSGTKLFRYTGGVLTAITGDIPGVELPQMVGVAIPGRELLFVSDGLTLQYYDGPTSGGVHALNPCSVPDDVPFVDLAVLNSYVIAAVRDSRRFYWLRPGETDFDALDFSSMESEPDRIISLAAVGDQLWIFGESSTEAWYPSGDADQPFVRAQGRAFSQGIIEGTLAQWQDDIVVVGQDRVVYRIAGQPERISNHGIEETLRKWEETAALRALISFKRVSELDIDFTGTVRYPDAVTYAWDFGDGNTDTGAEVSHSYAALGTYVVTLTVTAPSGVQGVVQRRIDVGALVVEPANLAGVWARTSGTTEQITLSWDDPNDFAATLARKVLIGATEIADLAAGVTEFVHTNGHATPLAGEVGNNYSVHYYIGAFDGPAATATVWSGPTAPANYATVPDPTRAYEFLASWQGTAGVTAVTEMQVDYLCLFTYVAQGDYAYNVTDKSVRVGNSAVVSATSPEIHGFNTRIRSKLTNFAVTDYSEWVETYTEVEGEAGEADGYNTCP